MPSMGATSGQNGAAFGSGEVLGTLANWTISETADTKTFAASNTVGGTGRRKGNIDWSGSAKQYVGWPSTGMMPGDAFDFLGFIAPRGGQPGGVGPFLGGPAMVERVTLTVDWAASALVELMTTFLGKGELVKSATDGRWIDESNPMAFPSSDVAVEICTWSSGNPIWLPLCATKAVLAFSAASTAFASSCTGPYVDRKGGTVDWSLLLTLNEADVSALPLTLKPNMYIGAKIKFLAEGLEYLLTWGLVKDFTNFNVDVETGAIITYDMLVEMSVDTGPDTGVDGEVLIPTWANPWWPQPIAAAPTFMNEGPITI